MLPVPRTLLFWLLLLMTWLPASTQASGLSLSPLYGQSLGRTQVAVLKTKTPSHKAASHKATRHKATGNARRKTAKLSRAASAASVAFSAAYPNVTGHRVYFHYQAVGAHEYGTIPTGGYTSQAAYLQDITEAAALGADGFSLDLGALDPATLDEMSRFFAAANQFNAEHPVPADSVNPAFTLFITLDCSTPGIESSRPVAAAFLRFALDPAYTRVKDARGNLRPRFSTYAGGGGDGWAAVRAVWNQPLALIKAAGIRPFFIPGFEQNPQVPGGPAPTDPQWVHGLLVGLADGDWEFASNYPPLGTTPGPSPIPGEEAKTAAVQAAGLYRESSIRNQAWATGSKPRFYNEYCGGEGLDAWWTSIITVQHPQSVQVLTWNDYDEASWTTNADEGPGSPWPYCKHSDVPGFYPSRLGLQKLYRYYIEWYKTGQKPRIAGDTLVAMYRTQTGAASAAPSADPLGGITYSADDTGGGPAMSHAPDVIYVDAFFVQKAMVTLTQGSRTTQRSAPAGHSHLRLPFVAGLVTLTVQRNGQTVLTLPGHAIAGKAALANANYYTCTAHN